jgi:formate/nitrite transporter FocA (FNT family)
VGALFLAYTGIFEPSTAAAAVELSEKGLKTGWWDLFFKGGVAGLVVAGVVWLDYAARDTVTRFVLVYLAFLVIPTADLFHVVVSFTELAYLVYLGEAAFLPGLAGFVLPLLLGNTLGGVLLVTVVNYVQTTERRLETARKDGVERQLSFREWIGGGSVGRSYVPADKDYDRRRRRGGREDDD